MRLIFKHMALAVLLVSAACTPEEKAGEKPSENIPVETVYAKGADISWVTEMEKDGMKFYGADGKETECTYLMKQIGMNSIRLRVWVDPEDGWCNKEDVLTKALRASRLGMRLMIDFHYSDTWADPSNQKVPASWADLNAGQMAEAVAGHTTEVLKLLKDNNIDITWIQIGNEVNTGMLHPMGNINQQSSAANFARFFNAGAAAAKALYPDAYIILHRSNGHETSKFEWFLDTARALGVKYDMIGMSLYPTWWENGAFVDWRTNTNLCISNIKSFSTKYGKPVMICEVGMPVSEPQMSKEALQYILDQTKAIDMCHGVFYWEPQVHSGWKPAYYDELGWGSYDKSAFADGRPTAALDPFKD